MFKIFIFHQKAWLTILIATYTTVGSCAGRCRKKDTTTPLLKSSTDPDPATPTASTTTSPGDTKPDNLNDSTDSLNSQTSSSSGVSSGSSSSGVSSGSFSSGVSSGSSSSGVSSGSASSAVSPPPAPTVFAGLPNSGNKCYMNAVLQIIAALYADKVEDPLKAIITKINTTHKPLDRTEVDQFINSLPESWAKKMATSSNQHDAEEFISGLNERSPFLGPIMVKNCEYTLLSPDAEVPLSMENVKSEQVSHLNILFERTESRSLSKMIDACSIISLLEGLPDCVSLTRNCYTLPDRLFIKLNRHVDNYKIIDYINDTMHITIQSDFSKQSTNAFDLNGFIVHQGNELGGHYIAYVKREGKWYEANDDRITEVGEPSAETASQKAYLLFYTKQ